MIHILFFTFCRVLTFVASCTAFVISQSGPLRSAIVVVLVLRIGAPGTGSFTLASRDER